ncbi:IGHMBP2 family helicase [Fulvivirga sp. RKSG066]|uniref:AAA domain-containing protein n=1 Tax=Fulvivirga aurantia TaxID=2529383 RepID=UPI0012BC4496|nr:AAA domain-containing protein [Fulvivirga aurantia]MTI21843.1 IGHMBP2 family helicase [Fulvivirga aurantia]
MMDAKASIKRQIELLEVEREQDYKMYQEKMMLSSIEDREREGVTWYPVHLVKDFISMGERITLVLEKTKNQKQRHSFQAGSIVGVFTGTDENGKSIPGVVSMLKDHTMHVVLNQTNLPDWVYDDKIGVNLLFDDNTYKEMKRTLKGVLKAENNRLAELRDIFYGNKEARFSNGYAYNLPGLNEVQNKAFSKITDAQDIALVHGPPGTGKTTTLTKCIADATRQEKQVLVCAPSNAAVDLLVEKLANEGLDVVRLGHPARLTPEVIENSVDVKISKHPDFSRLRELRKKSEEYRRMAKKYKRNFGRKEKTQRDLLFSESRILKEESRQLESYIAENLIDHAQVIACTLTGANHQMIKDRVFKTCFIDEASQALEAACWIPLDRVERVIMSGDHYQLPPTIKSIEAAKGGLEQTLFAKGIENQVDSTVMLETQYRMHNAIMGFSSDYFYQGKLKADESINHRPAYFEQPITFIDTAGAGYNEELKKETLSTFNRDEGLLLGRLMGEDLPPADMSVGIIAPYKAQIELIRGIVNRSEKLAPIRENISINTVDAFQGQERDVMYISLTRSNDKGEIGFLKEYRRMNVALTRARYKLVVIGDSATLGNDPFYARLIDYVQANGGYASVFEYIYSANE